MKKRKTEQGVGHWELCRSGRGWVSMFSKVERIEFNEKMTFSHRFEGDEGV